MIDSSASRAMARAIRLPTLAALFALCFCARAADVEKLPRIEVTGNYNNGVGTSDAASEGSVNARLIENRPVLRPGEVLEFVPGLIVSQHSGDGKANQYYLRGFNLVHGTDFATFVDGMPINMRTHAHGQGYTITERARTTPRKATSPPPARRMCVCSTVSIVLSRHSRSANTHTHAP